MFKFIISFLIALFILLPSTVNLAAEFEPVISIVGVHSYTIDNSSTAPQLNGFYQGMLGINYKMHHYFMNAKVKNVTEEQRKQVADYIIKSIIKIHPDYVYITDDTAFEYVGIPLIKNNIKIVVSGLNKDITLYYKDFNIKKYENNVIAIEENTNLENFFKIIDKARIRPNKYYILYDDSETSYYMSKEYAEQLKNTSHDFIKINTVDELKAFISSTQNDSTGVYVITLQTLYNRDTRQYESKEEFFKYFRNYNAKHLELTSNTLLPMYGYAIACGPDFIEMGKQSALYLKENIQHSTFKFMISKPESSISINSKRLEQLNFYRILDANYNSIQKQY